jgi:membrane-bound metal-dependent hydrolase YbcI (DUF457 family)
MFLGHYGLAFAAKRAAPRASLGTLFFAAQFLDELWPIFLLMGLEQVHISPGLMKANALDFASYPYSHSLGMAAVWSVLVGGVHYALRRDRRAALVVGGLVLSHWFLDLPMHRPDLPLWPGTGTRVGGSLWNSIPATLVIELGLFGLGLFAYVSRTRARDGMGRWTLWSLVAALLLIYVSGLVGAPPPSERAVAIVTLGLWLFVPWAAWADRHRDVVATTAG